MWTQTLSRTTVDNWELIEESGDPDSSHSCIGFIANTCLSVAESFVGFGSDGVQLFNNTLSEIDLSQAASSYEDSTAEIEDRWQGIKETVSSSYEALPEGLIGYSVGSLLVASLWNPQISILAASLAVGWVAKKLLFEEDMPNPNRVYHIYKLPKLTKTFLGPYTGKIVELGIEEKSHIIGFSLAEEGKQRRLCPIYISGLQKDNESDVIRFSAHTLENDKEVGYVDFLPITRENNFCQRYRSKHKQPVFEEYGFLNQRTGIFLKKVVVYNREDYRHIDAALIKTIFSYFYRDCYGYMALEASEDSHPHLYRLGFRALYKNDEPLNAIFARMVHSGRIKESRSCIMGLPDDAIGQWIQEIRENPIVDIGAFQFQILLHKACRI